MKASIRLGKIAGIDVGIHYSWFAVLALVTWSVAEGFLPSQYPRWSTTTYWLTGLISALMLFASVLVHELAHSLVARARGFRVEGITLFLLGGVSNLRSESRRPRDEFAISVVGPVASFGLAVLFWAVVWVTRESNAPAAAVVWYLALINLILAVFNLLPAFPLDGGRVLRSIIWAATGSLTRATTIAARGGQGVGLLLMALGAYQVMTENLLAGLWYVFIGWFLHSSATNSRREVATEAQFRGVKVKEVMEVDPLTIHPDASLSDAVYVYFLRRSVRSMPVCDEDRLSGIISLSDVRDVPQARWTQVRVRDQMTPLPLRHVMPDDDLSSALDLLGEHSIHQVPVLEAGLLVGLLSRAHVIQYFHNRTELGIR